MINRQTSVYQGLIDEWIMSAFVLRFHFGLAFLIVLFGLSYSYTTYIIATEGKYHQVYVLHLHLLLGQHLYVYDILRKTNGTKFLLKFVLITQL